MAKRATATAASARTETGDGTLRQFVGYNLKRAYMAILDDLHRVLGQHNLRLATFSALALVSDNPDIAQGELAQALSVERSSVVVIVDDLETRQLVTRNKVLGDRRAYALRVTLKGRQLLDRLQDEIAAHENRFFGQLSAAERATLVGLLNRVEGAAADAA
jgi:DNA-binding MarR family transcriptional regulator